MLEDRILTWRFNHGQRQALRDIYEKYKNQLVTLAAALLHNKTNITKNDYEAVLPIKYYVKDGKILVKERVIKR